MIKIKINENQNNDNERYIYIKSKSVFDADGWQDDYTMYYDTYENRYVFVLGDSDIYGPEDGYFDWECETEEEANEWFDNYDNNDE